MLVKEEVSDAMMHIFRRDKGRNMLPGSIIYRAGWFIRI